MIETDRTVPHVAICIATYRRPDGLRRVLQSLNVQTFTASVPSITVVVVDNDNSSLLSPNDLSCAFPLIYVKEPKRGLAAVRNACLIAAPVDANYIAFIDDDEWAAPEWLDALIDMQQQTGADVVQGPVRPVYPVTPPAWMSRGGYHEVGPFEDGAELQHGASGNVLIRRMAIAATGARFHEDFDQAGGEDVDFFEHLRAHGCTIVAAARAVAYEAVPTDRMTLGWVLRRRFRTGHTLGQVARRHGGLRMRVIKAVARMCAGIAEGAVGLLASRTRAVRGLTNIAWGLGTVAAVARLPTLNDRKTRSS